MKNFKFLSLIAILAIIHLTAKADPGILEVVFKTANVQESILLEQRIGEIVLVSIFNSENQVVYQMKHVISKSNKVFCKLSKDVYTVVIADLNNRNKNQIHRISLQ